MLTPDDPPLWLVSGATRTVAANPALGVLLSPRARRARLPKDRPWAVDNDSFTRDGFDRQAFLALLMRWRFASLDCLFVAVPDVVGDARATDRLWPRWAPLVRRLGYPAAYVLQDGADGYPPDADALFVGGTTDYKLSTTVRAVVARAHDERMWVHMGRVNTERRYGYATDLRVCSVDGTHMSRWPERGAQLAARWRRERRLPLEGGTR